MSSNDGIIKKTKKGHGVDPCWEYGEEAEPNCTTKVKCKFCTVTFNGGITRFKNHLAGIQGNVRPCLDVPADVKKKVQEIIKKAGKVKEQKATGVQNVMNDVRIDAEEFLDDDVSATGGESSCRSNQMPLPKRCGPMDKYANRTPEEMGEGLAKTKQTTIDSHHRKVKRENTIRYIARWFFEAGIPFNAAQLDSFQQMLHAVGLYGPFLEAPSPYELSETCLDKEVEETEEYLKKFKETCSISGCSLMTDAWSDRKHRSIMNIVAHCPAGLAFLDSEDVSAERHSGNFIYNFVDKAIEKIGEKNVVQIVTDNASNNMAAAKMLTIKRPGVFWTSCAAHTVNLMLGDIAKIKPIRNAITMGREISVFIYNHTITVSILRELTHGGDILRPGATRFATSFLSLSSLREKKIELKKMFSDQRWEECDLSSKPAGRKV